MAKLKEKVLRALRNNGQLDVTLNEVSQSQENLLKIIQTPYLAITIKIKY